MTGAGVEPPGTWADVVGQPEAVARLRSAVAQPVHAYLFVGPRGTGKRAAAAAFAGALFARDDPGGAVRHVDLARRFAHPDLHLVAPQGRTFRVQEADDIIHEASRAPIEANHKVIVADRFHTAEPTVAPKLLKTIEEPPAGTVIVLLATDVPLEHVTIASRCVQVDFGPVDPGVLADVLVGEGADPDRAATIAEVAGGSLDRARLLASDEAFLTRLEAWRSVPDRLDGTGAAVAVLVDELRGLIDDAQAPLAERHRAELAELAEREERLGTRGSGRKDLEERHKREVRLVRDDELRSGLAAVADVYRQRLATGGDARAASEAMKLLAEMGEQLVRNPNEPLALQALFVRLARLAG